MSRPGSAGSSSSYVFYDLQQTPKLPLHENGDSGSDIDEAEFDYLHDLEDMNRQPSPAMLSTETSSQGSSEELTQIKEEINLKMLNEKLLKDLCREKRHRILIEKSLAMFNGVLTKVQVEILEKELKQKKGELNKIESLEVQNETLRQNLNREKQQRIQFSSCFHKANDALTKLQAESLEKEAKQKEAINKAEDLEMLNEKLLQDLCKVKLECIEFQKSLCGCSDLLRKVRKENSEKKNVVEALKEENASLRELIHSIRNEKGALEIALNAQTELYKLMFSENIRLKLKEKTLLVEQNQFEAQIEKLTYQLENSSENETVGIDYSTERSNSEESIRRQVTKKCIVDIGGAENLEMNSKNEEMSKLMTDCLSFEKLFREKAIKQIEMAIGEEADLASACPGEYATIKKRSRREFGGKSEYAKLLAKEAGTQTDQVHKNADKILKDLSEIETKLEETKVKRLENQLEETKLQAKKESLKSILKIKFMENEKRNESNFKDVLLNQHVHFAEIEIDELQEELRNVEMKLLAKKNFVITHYEALQYENENFDAITSEELTEDMKDFEAEYVSKEEEEEEPKICWTARSLN